MSSRVTARTSSCTHFQSPVVDGASFSSSSHSADDPTEKMDRMYRGARYVYDQTRRCYLLRWDQMLDRVTDRPLVRVLKVGCGTARNLRVLARKVPHNSLYGIDACLAMFATAREALDKRRRPSLQFCYGRLTI